MKIAQIAPLYEAVPPRLYGGTERIVAHLCDALVDLGHEVTLFSSADARTHATLVPVRDQAIRLDPAPLKSDLAAHLSMLHEVRRRADEFDVLHFHVDLLHFPLFQDQPERTLTTLHGRLDVQRPRLPPGVDQVSFRGLEVGGREVDLVSQRSGGHVLAFTEGRDAGTVPVHSL